jgi:hypothetical protein
MLPWVRLFCAFLLSIFARFADPVSARRGRKLTTSLPPDFQIDDAEVPGVHVDELPVQSKYIGRLSKLREQFDQIIAAHDAAVDLVDRRRFLTSLAAIRRKMLWYESRIPGAQQRGDGALHTRGRLSDQLISLDPILSRLP